MNYCSARNGHQPEHHAHASSAHAHAHAHAHATFMLTLTSRPPSHPRSLHTPTPSTSDHTLHSNENGNSLPHQRTARFPSIARYHPPGPPSPPQTDPRRKTHRSRSPPPWNRSTVEPPLGFEAPVPSPLESTPESPESGQPDTRALIGSPQVTHRFSPNPSTSSTTNTPSSGLVPALDTQGTQGQ